MQHLVSRESMTSTTDTLLALAADLDDGGLQTLGSELRSIASLFRKESRWGLYHYRLDYPELDNQNWFCHVNLKKDAAGNMSAFKRPVAPYIVPLDAAELSSYHHIRVPSTERAGIAASP